MRPASSVNRRRLAVLAMALLLAWLPLAGYAMPMPQQQPAPSVAGETPIASMPCHAQHQPVEQAKPDPACKMTGGNCDCCDHAVPASLPAAALQLGSAGYRRAQRLAQPLAFSPEPPLHRHLRPPRFPA